MSEVKVKFGAEDTNLSSTLNKVERELKQLGNSSQEANNRFSSNIKGMGAAAAGFTAGLAALGAVTSAAFKVMSEYAGYDSLIRSLKTMDGTAEATAARIEKLRAVAALPGLGFEEAIKGDVRLRAAGISADLAERSLRSVGNALASAGGGKAELDGVILALGQISSKGKVSAEEINQIAERLPQVRAAMKDAFGTADTEAIQKMGISSTEFITGLVAELEKLPAVTSGAQNTLDNFGDAWKALKVQAAEFGVQMAGTWIDNVTRSFAEARRQLLSLKEAMGFKTPGLEGKDGKTEVARQAELEADKKLKIEQESALAEAKLHNKNLEFWQEKQRERTEYLRSESEKRIKIEDDANKRTVAAQEAVFAATLNPSQNITRKIKSLVSEGPVSADAVNSEKDPEKKAAIADRLAKIVTLQKELNDLQKQSEETQRKELEIANERRAILQDAKTDLDIELESLRLRRSGQSDLANSITAENNLRKESLELAKSVNISEDEALRILRDKKQVAEEIESMSKGLSDRTSDRQKKRDDNRQAKIVDARLRNRGGDGNTKKERDALRDLTKDIKKDLNKPGEDKRPGGKDGGKGGPEGTLLAAVEAIKTLVAKIEPKLPTTALGI